MKSKIISVVLCLGVVLALMLVPGAPPPKVSLAQANDWGFEIQPNVTKVGFNEAFTVNATVTYYSGHSAAWAMYLLFDPTYLEVTAIDTPSTLPSGEAPDAAPGMPAWNNTTGWAQHGYSIPPGSTNYINVTFVYCTVHFRSKSASGTSYLNFTTTDPSHATQVQDEFGTDYLNWTRVVNGTVMVGTALTVNVTPAGKGTVKANGVTLTGYPNTTTRSWDALVSLEAVNSTPGWGFVNWTGNLTGSTNPTSITMNATAKNVTANFAEQPPALSVSPSSLTLTVAPDATGNTTYNVSNSGGGTLSWNSSNVTYDPDGNMTWLTQNVTNGTLGIAESHTVLVTANTTGLEVGTYNATINITGNSSVELPVTLIVGLPAISVSPTSLTFTTNEGENPADKTLEVCNSGTGTLDWELTDDAAWLSATPTSGSLGADDCEDVTVSVDASGLAAGDYSAAITITGSPTKTVPVNLHIVSAMPELPVAPASLSASGLSISPQQVEPGQQVTISINVANRGGETGSYNAVLYINGVAEDSQSVSVAPGMTKNVIFMVSKSDAGVYDVSIAGQSGQFEVVHTGWFGGGLGTGGIVAIVVIVIVLILALFFVLRGTRRAV